MLRVAVLTASLLAADAIAAAVQTRTRIRGTIERVSEHALTIKARHGQTVTVTLVRPHLRREEAGVGRPW